jgi:hypothetical protein
LSKKKRPTASSPAINGSIRIRSELSGLTEKTRIRRIAQTTSER